MRRRVFEILTTPRPDDRLAKIINVALLLLIAANVVANIVETDAELARQGAAFFRWFEIISVAVFTVEYVLRLWSCTASPAVGGRVSSRLRQALRPMTLIDLVAIAPFYLDLLVPGGIDLRFLRVMRLMRLMRLFRVGPVSAGFARLGRVIMAKRVELGVSMSVVAVATVLAAGGMYLVEHHEEGSPFTSIPRAMWWSVVTITTVGYGDMTPVTPLGKTLGSLVALIGVCSLALPVGIISSGYITEPEPEDEDDEEPTQCPHCGRVVPPRRSVTT